MRRWSTVVAVLALVFSVGLVPASASGGVVTARPGDGLVRPVVRHPFVDNQFYFLLLDRFAAGDASTDYGDHAASEGPSVHGFDPTNSAYYHGGDFAGLANRMEYLAGMGTTAIWVNPIFKNMSVMNIAARNDATEGSGAGDQGAYHGYWILDFLRADPHWGSEQAFRDMLDAAHAHGVKVFLDVELDATADVIQYDSVVRTLRPYAPKSLVPYKDANGQPFDDRDYVGTGVFPPLDAQTSFPYQPFIADAEKSLKNPAWMNDPIYYHNRGISDFQGEDEDSTYGDVFGLDDLFTEHPVVERGLIDIYRYWIRNFPIDGFRIDTVKHVNMEFWQAFAPAMQQAAEEAGRKDFYMFGEVYNTDPAFTSRFTTTGKLPSVLDFPFQSAARSFASQSTGTDGLRDLFASDDYYTDADSNAYGLATFLGNHDMGRFGYFLKQDNSEATDAELVARDKLGHALMYFARGTPIVYYGDEQGFTGEGQFEGARQDMFASRTESYRDDDLIGTDATPADDNFDSDHPLYQELATLAAVRQQHQALRTGAQIHRYSSDTAGIYAFSRIDRDEQVEYLVALNNSTTAKSATFTTASPDTTLTPIYPATATNTIKTNEQAEVTVTVPALSAVVYRADGKIARSTAPIDVQVVEPADATHVGDRFWIQAELDTNQPAEVTFAIKTGDGTYVPIGTDDNAPYRIHYDASHLTNPTRLEIVAISNDLQRHTTTSTPTTVVAGAAQ